MILDDQDLWGMLEPFSVEVIAFADTGDETRFRAIFDKPTQMYGDDLELSGSNPTLTARTIDVTAVDQYSSIKINNALYRVRDVEPDGTGITKLVLKK